MDITLCTGGNCPVRFTCHRFDNNTVKNYSKSKISFSSYFVKPPYKSKNKKFDCDFYWGEPQNYLLEELNSILNGGRKKRP